MAIAIINEEAFRGDTVTFDVTNIKKGGAAVDFTGCSFWCTGKRSRGLADAAAVFQVTGTLNAQGQVTAPESGKLSVKLLPAATSTLPAARTELQIDVQYKDLLNDVWTVASGILMIEPDVTVAA